MKKSNKKLKLNKDIVSILNKSKMKQIDGGANGQFTDYCTSKPCHPNPFPPRIINIGEVDVSARESCFNFIGPAPFTKCDC